MKSQAFNPYLPSYEYVPDGEPHVFGERVYVYGSHDRFDGLAFCLNDYICWSAPLSDLSAWRYEGVILPKKATPPYLSDDTVYWAPDVCQGHDGRYYMVYFVGESHPHDNRIRVAVSDKPSGPFAYYGAVHYLNGQDVGMSKGELKSFDPAIFVDDDGRIYLYSGFGAPVYNPFIQHGWKSTDQGPLVYELEPDMLSVKKGPYFLGIPSAKTGKGTEFEGHEFFEASSLRKFNGKYYFIYSSINGHELCYAISDKPDSGFHYGGTLVSIGDVGLDSRSKKDALNYLGNTHGSLAKLGEKYYVFYHRQTNLKQYSRQGCADEIKMDAEGHFAQAEITSCGLNGGPLIGLGTYEARIACNLVGGKGTIFYGFLKMKMLRRAHPYFTQDGVDREENPDQHIANLSNGAWCGFKYFDFQKPTSLSVKVRGNAKGDFIVSTSQNGPALGKIALSVSKDWTDFKTALLPVSGVHPLYFRYVGKGHFDFMSFTLA